ncbi:MAG TPA: nucleoside hydrolase [Candidatus Limnocylindrales bacterium]
MADDGRDGAHPRVPLLLDVDTGIDDALALLYAAASSEAELVAVTALHGNADVSDTERNTRAVLELAGRGDVEVAAGSLKPLLRPLETTPETHGPGGLGYATLPEPARPASARFGPEVIVDAARRRPGELTLVTLGPLTNLAVAVLAEPHLPRLLRRWVAMAGAFRVPGNTTPVSEWNIHCDPEAARIALGAWQAAVDADEAQPRAMLIGLDVTEQARLLPGHLDALAARCGDGPLVDFTRDALRFYFEFHARYDGFYGAFVHDPFVVAAALDPALVRTKPASVDVDASRGPGDGQTIADWRRTTGRRPNADVAVEGDADAFLARLIGRVGGLAAARTG